MPRRKYPPWNRSSANRSTGDLPRGGRPCPLQPPNACALNMCWQRWQPLTDHILDFLSLRQAHQSFDNTVCENASNKTDRLGRWVAGWWLHLVRGRNAFLLEFLPALGMVYLCSLSSKYFLQFLVCLCAEATWWFFPLDLALYISFLPQCFSAPAAWGGHWGPLSIYKFIVYHFQGIKIYRATPEKWETEFKG